MVLTAVFFVFLMISVLSQNEGFNGTCCIGDQCTNKVDPFALACRNWNATILVHARSLQRQIAVSFNVFCIYMECFQHFEVLLFQPEKNDCNIGIVVDYQRLQNNNSGNHILFNNLSSGSYCAKVIPAGNNCGKTDVCTVLNSNIEYLTGSLVAPSTVELSLYESPESLKTTYVLTSVGVLLIFVLLVGAVLMWNYKICCPGDRKPDPIPDPTVSGTHGVSKLNLRNETNCVVLHRPDKKFEAKALCNVLSECMHYNAKCLDDYLHLLIVNDILCVSNLISYTCTKNELGDFCDISSEKKIIILESAKTIICQTQKKSTMEKKNIDERLNDAFNLSISMLTSGYLKCLKDYCHIFIVRFNEFTTDDTIKELVPKRRYILPEHLVDLYFDLNDVSLKQVERDDFVEKLLSTWKQKSSYTEFVNSV